MLSIECFEDLPGKFDRILARRIKISQPFDILKI